MCRDFNGNLDREVFKIQQEKDRRDRIGYLFGTVVANTNINLDGIGADLSENSRFREPGYKSFNYKKLFEN